MNWWHLIRFAILSIWWDKQTRQIATVISKSHQCIQYHCPAKFQTRVRPFDWLSHHHFLFDVSIYILILLTRVDESATSAQPPTVHEQRLLPLANTHYKPQRVTWSRSIELHAVSKGILLIRIHTFNHALPT